VEPLREGPQHIRPDFETRGSDSGADRGHEVPGATAIANQTSNAISGQAGLGSAPAAMGQDGARSDGIRHDHREAVGVTDQGRLARAQQERVAGGGFAVFVDDGSMLLQALAHRPGNSQPVAKATDVLASSGVEGLAVQVATETPAGDRAVPRAGREQSYHLDRDQSEIVQALGPGGKFVHVREEP